MTKHEKVLTELSDKLKQKSRAVIVTGSVARGDSTKNSDLDILVITKKGHSFKEKIVDGVTVEIKSNSLIGFKNKMKKDPMNIYQWMDAIAIYDPDDLLIELKVLAQEIFDNYTPLTFPTKWLSSAKIKIRSAHESQNHAFLSFHVSSNLWKVVEGFYLLNGVPTPPSSTAFKNITSLKKLPENFSVLWEKSLKGELEERAHTMILFIEFLESSRMS